MNRKERRAAGKGQDVNALMSAAVTWHRQGRLKEAVNTYQQVIRLEPRLADAHANLGVALKALGQLAPAIAANGLPTLQLGWRFARIPRFGSLDGSSHPGDHHRTGLDEPNPSVLVASPVKCFIHTSAGVVGGDVRRLSLSKPASQSVIPG